MKIILKLKSIDEFDLAFNKCFVDSNRIADVDIGTLSSVKTAIVKYLNNGSRLNIKNFIRSITTDDKKIIGTKVIFKIFDYEHLKMKTVIVKFISKDHK